MTDAEREELEQQAGEYALGTLAGDERRRFEARLAADPALRAQVEDWQRRIGPLAEGAPAVEPPPSVWWRIEAATAPPVYGAGDALPLRQRIARSLYLWWCLSFWRWSALVGVGAAAALALYIAAAPVAPPAPAYAAVLNDAQAKPAWLVTADRAGRRIAAQPLAATGADARALELWAIPDGGKPRSLGLLDRASVVARDLPADLAGRIGSGVAFAVSAEPPGGSPTGQPTGPVLYQGVLLAIAR
ncbi:MAG: anti-sigma factor [Rhodospirillales bacterium]|nr:anti-sigma factor [Rhodospirillales bacterium]